MKPAVKILDGIENLCGVAGEIAILASIVWFVGLCVERESAVGIAVGVYAFAYRLMDMLIKASE